MGKKLEELALEELYSLYEIVNSICAEFSKMTDNYSLATGDSKFESIPEDVKGMIKDRQKFFSYKLRLRAALTNKVNEKMNEYE